ncbi:MAG: DNA gyrase subunit B, partial [Candidatus Paceibacteria bacterium]
MPEEREIFKKVVKLGTYQGTSHRMPPTLPLNRSLVELLGLYAAEGCTLDKTKRVVFSFGSHEEDLIRYTQKLIHEAFRLYTKVNIAHPTARVIQIDSALIHLVFRRIFNVGRVSSLKCIPDFIWGMPQELRERYLIAYLAGDGYPSKVFVNHLIAGTAPGPKSRRKFVLATSSKQLWIELSYLLWSLSKTFSLAKNGRHIDFYWNTESSYFNRIPYNEAVSWCSDGMIKYRIRRKEQVGISPTLITTLFQKKKLQVFPGVFQFVESDLGLLRIRKIEKVSYDYPWVYDLSVPNGENFVAGWGPIVAHNSLDEAMAGYAKNIEIKLLSNNRVSVKDDGRGIPVDMHPQTKKSALETVMTTLHAGGKFGGQSYKIAGGLHGVGVSVVCALSRWMRAEVCRDGYVWAQEYARGKPKTKVIKDGKCGKTGTTVIFEPDPEIFSEIRFDWKRILDHLREQAYLTKGVHIKVIDERDQTKPALSHSFYFEGGLITFINYLTKEEEPLHKEIFYVSREYEGILVEIALRYTNDIQGMELSFANNIRTGEGGMHLTGFRTALTRVLNDYARENGFIKESDENLTGDDVREGLIAVISVKLREPQFEGQTKAKLGNPEARSAVDAVLGSAFKEFLEKNQQEARLILDKVILAAKARQAAKAAKEAVLRKGALEGASLPGKLADCTSKHPEESELFIVEGDSAGGSAKQARDRRFQAILPLRGKILNVEKARIDKMLVNQEIRSLIVALGTAIANDFNLSKLRYHRIIIMTDADSDGAHIRTLLLTLFYRYFLPVIENGHLYIAQPPLYRLQKGKEVRYAYSDQEKIRLIAELTKKEGSGKTARKLKLKKISEEEALAGPEAEDTELKGITIQRYKGLGVPVPSLPVRKPARNRIS